MSQLTTLEYNSQPIAFDISDESQYICLTDMAKATGKRVDNWLENKSTQELLDAWKNRYQDSRNGFLEPIVVVQGGDIKSANAQKQGTWAHVDIAIQFAQWCSPSFALWISEQIDQLLTTGTVNLGDQLGNHSGFQFQRFIDEQIQQIVSTELNVSGLDLHKRMQVNDAIRKLKLIKLEHMCNELIVYLKHF